MHTVDLGKYFSRLVAVDLVGCRILTAMQLCTDVGTGLDGPRWQPPHTFGYEPNALLRHFYSVPLHAAGAGESDDEQTMLRYTTDDAISTEKRKQRSISLD